MKASISVRDLSKTFALSESGSGPVSLREALRSGQRVTTTRSVEALRNVSFEVAQGERVGLIGRNGAGKTTLLSILAGVAEPTSGSVAIQGDVHAMLTIGAVLRDEATGRENIYLDGAVHGRTREDVESHAEEVIAFADIGEFIDRPVRTYSSGMKARLAFSMGAFVNPDVLIIDETLAVGDSFFAAKAMKRMKEIAAKGRIVFVVSHALASIVDMCNRCIWMDQGRIVMDGDPATVTKAYENAVSQADESELARKFEAGETIVPRPPAGALQSVSLRQGAEPRVSTVRAFQPLTITVAGALNGGDGGADIIFDMVRVDGRSIWTARLSDIVATPLPARGPFTAEITFEPFLLSANLYGLDVRLTDGQGIIDARRRAFEVVDEEGQFGGQPVLYLSPDIRAWPLAET